MNVIFSSKVQPSGLLSDQRHTSNMQKHMQKNKLASLLLAPTNSNKLFLLLY